MDRELEKYVDEAMEKQQYRNGIFANWMEYILQGISDYRALQDVRGAQIRRGGKQMDRYLEKYVDEVMDKQVYRDGIGFSSSWIKRIFSRKNTI